MNNDKNNSQSLENNKNIVNKEIDDINDDFEVLEEIDENNQSELSDGQNEEIKNNAENNVKKIKILNKEFNYEDVILVIIGLVIIVAIFLLPRIMNIFY